MSRIAMKPMELMVREMANRAGNFSNWYFALAFVA